MSTADMHRRHAKNDNPRPRRAIGVVLLIEGFTQKNDRGLAAIGVLLLIVAGLLALPWFLLLALLSGR
jgi:hypothetical protein